MTNIQELVFFVNLLKWVLLGISILSALYIAFYFAVHFGKRDDKHEK